MPAYKNEKTNTWYVSFYYRDFTGTNKKKKKMGFSTKKEAVEWERKFLLKKAGAIEMTFEDFYKVYESDMKPRLKYNTWLTKKHIIETKILPYFSDKKMTDIKPADIVKWQNKMIAYQDTDGKAYSPVYLKTIHNQLSAIFNHAVRLYELPSNPVHKSGSMGKEKSKEMLVWTKEEYLQFSEAIKDKPLSFYAFKILYWCGIRLGELLALTANDINFEAKTIRINKSYQRLEQTDIITVPKTEKSNRLVAMPDFLCTELKDYEGMLYGYLLTDRIFQVTKSYLHHEMDRGAKKAGVKRIRIHDLRH